MRFPGEDARRYNLFLARRGQIQGLPSATPRERAVVRLCCLARNHDPKSAAEVRAAACQERF